MQTGKAVFTLSCDLEDCKAAAIVECTLDGVPGQERVGSHLNGGGCCGYLGGELGLRVAPKFTYWN